jgi:hypothetical protein
MRIFVGCLAQQRKVLDQQWRVWIVWCTGFSAAKRQRTSEEKNGSRGKTKSDPGYLMVLSFYLVVKADK